MRFKKTMSILIAAAMLAGTFTAVGSVSAYADEEAAKSVDTLEVGNFATYPTYAGGDLGANYTPEKTTFKVWAPTATEVDLMLYSHGDDESAGEAGTAISSTAMTLDKDTGVWSTVVEGDNKNVYYTYFIKNALNPEGVEVVDIYAKAAGVNGNRGMVVDLDSTDPAGWENDKHVMTEEATDATVWEVHIKDFSYDPDSGVSEKNRGKYLAFTELETTLENAGDVKTCMNYIKDLGISYVQINPMYDFGSVDEAGDDTQFNWGYDPKNYNVPEGSYSSNPYDGNVRINEMKQMIKALHDNGIGVIMDVVYNHTYSSGDSWFNLTEPDYYYRQTADGGWSNGSGCGNDTASEREMFKNFMVDSVVYWANEYHIDGFRFDLMGLHDCDTMNVIREELDKIDTRIITYGEGWVLGTTVDKMNWAGNRTQLCEQSKCMRVSERIGFFNDDARDSIKGKAFDDLTSPGFVSDTKGSFASKLYDSIKGHYDGSATWKTQVPGQNVMYSCCHDNQTLYDRLVASTYGTDTNMYGVRDEDFVASNKLSAAIVMTSQGLPFILAGEEFARTKYGDHNSYKSSPDINMLDWSRVPEFADLIAYYKGCIKLRENFDAFSDGTHASGDAMEKLDVPAGMIGYSLDNLADAQGQWSNVLVYFNGNGEEAEVTLPGGSGSGLLGDVDGDGKVSAKDALVILRYTINLAKLDDNQLKLADVDGDGKVSAKDSMLIQRYTINLAKIPAQPSGAEAKDYVVVANDQTAGLAAIETVSGKATVKANSALILVPKDSFDAAALADEDTAYVEVKHVDKATGDVFYTTTIKGKPGQAYETYSVNNLAVEYDVDSTSDNTSGKMTEGTTTVYYYYVPFPGGIGTVTVKHVDQDGKALADPTQLRARNGDSYTTIFRNFTWYDLDKDNYPANAEGTFDGETEVVYKYIYNKPERTTELVTSTMHLKITGEDFHPNFYIWDTDLKTGKLPQQKDWPGNKLTKDANGWYNFTFENYNTYSWIVNGDNGQTADMVGSGDLWLVAASSPQSIVVYKENPFGDEDKPAEDSEDVETKDLPVRSDEPVSATIHVSIEDTVFNPCLYIWDPAGGELSKAWPGNKLTEADEDGWYTFTFENYNDYNWILNDGKGNQTEDMEHYSGDIWIVAHGSATNVTVTTEKP